VKTPASILAATLALCGCSGNYWAVSANSMQVSNPSASSAQVNVSAGLPLSAAIVVGIMAADSYHYYRVEPNGMRTYAPAPDPDPTRRINVQDCTKPVDPRAGNLMCK